MLILTEPTNLGYVQSDDRAAGGRNVEFNTYTCTHCCTVVVMNPDRRRERYKCRGCDHLICDNCGAARAAGAACKTFKQLVDEVLTAAEKTSAGGILLP